MERGLKMAIISNSKNIIPGTAIYSLLKQNIGHVINITTTTGLETGQLMAIDANFLTIVSAASETKYVWSSEIVTFSFSS
jgi:dihydroxyacetone kinase DhaKLM complex PTS-EIIA-like component DhaM